MPLLLPLPDDVGREREPAASRASWCSGVALGLVARTSATFAGADADADAEVVIGGAGR